MVGLLQLPLAARLKAFLLPLCVLGRQPDASYSFLRRAATPAGVAAAEPVSFSAWDGGSSAAHSLADKADGDNLTYVARALALGASGYVPRAVRRRELLEMIRTAAAGKPAWSPKQLARFTGTPDLLRGCDIHLTPRERELLRHLGYGLSNLEIASAMGIGYETAKEHVQHSLRKLGARSRVLAAAWAIKNGLS